MENCGCEIKPNTLEETDELMIKVNALNDAPLEENIENPFALTSEVDSQEMALIEEYSKFEVDYEKFKNIISSIQNPDDRRTLIVNFYNNIPNEAWNKAFEKAFNTKDRLFYAAYTKQNQKLLKFNITKAMVTNLSEIKYKTSACERTKAWLINEDANFSDDKPEVLANMKYNLYKIVAEVEEETIRIPYQTIIDNLKQLDKTWIGLFEYVIALADPKNENNLLKSIKQKGFGPKFLEDNFEFLHVTLRYRNHKFFNYNAVWNVILRPRIVCKEIGYFTVGHYNKFIGNIWVDDNFRGKGLLNNIFKYIKKEILPKEKFLFISTKTDAVLHCLSKFDEFDYKKDEYKFRVNKLGLTLPYKSPIAKSNEKGLDYPIENTFVLSHNDNELEIQHLKNISKFGILNDWFFTESFYPTVISHISTPPDTNYPTMADLYFATRSWSKPKPEDHIKIIGYTNDKNIIPSYYNYYIDGDEYIKHLVYEYDGEIYLYPCYQNELHFGLPNIDIRTVSKKVDFDYEIYYTPTNTLFEIKYPINKVIVLGEDFIKDQENLGTKNFRMMQFIRFMTDSYLYGIENSFNGILNNERYKTKIDEKFKIDNLTPIGFDTKTLDVKFEDKDKSFTLTKNIKEIINFLL